MISRLRLIFAVLALGVVPTAAQDSADSGKYFRTVGAGAATRDLYFSSEGKDKNITVQDGYRSLLYNGKGTGQLAFYTISTGPDGKTLRTVVAQADIRDAGPLSLLTFSPDPEAPGHYRVEVLADDLSTFPLGSYRIVNRSALPVQVILGQNSEVVQANETRLVVYRPPARGMGIPALVYTANSDRKRLLYANTWAYNDHYRTEILVSPRPGRSNFISVSRMLDNPSVLLMKEYLPKD